MKTAILTDAETNKPVLVVFGEGGVVFAKTNQDSEGEYTELFDAEKDQIVAVKESPDYIQRRLS